MKFFQRLLVHNVSMQLIKCISKMEKNQARLSKIKSYELFKSLMYKQCYSP